MPPRFAFAGDRDISVWVLDYLLQRGCTPSALLVSAPDRASHALELESRIPRQSGVTVFRGADFRAPEALETLGAMRLDYIVAVHFPYIFPPAVLRIPRRGVLNLHPALLPYNRGWHTASWAILEGTPIGATLHFMDEGVDTGDIVHQQSTEVSPADTADTLYQRLKRLELDVFQQAWPSIEAGSVRRTPQSAEQGSAHTKAELLRDSVRRIDCDDQVRAGDLLRRLRGLTTSEPAEAAYFEADGVRYRVRLSVQPER
jgi:methionyl-tRNA formyltransferase